MIAEWATGEFPYSPDTQGMRKPEWIRQALDLFRTRYPRIKAAVYWHERWQNKDQSYSNLRMNSSVESLNAYREGVAHPDWLGDLSVRKIPGELNVAAPLCRAVWRTRRPTFAALRRGKQSAVATATPGSRLLFRLGSLLF